MTIKELPGIGPLTVKMLMDNGIYTLEELAKVEPYDERFRILGENLLTYVYYARKWIAEQTVKEVVVTPSYIKVICSKDYDEEATKKAVMGKLEIYDLYVQCQVKEYKDRREFLFTLKPEMAKYALADWEQYRFLAKELQRQLKLKGKKVHLKQSHKPFSLEKALKGLPFPLKELTEVFMLAQFVPNFNLLVILDKDSLNRSLLRNFLKAYTIKPVHWICGNNDPSDLSMALMSACGGTIFIDDPQLSSSVERTVLLSLLSSGKILRDTSGDVVEIPVDAKVVAMIQLGNNGFLDREMLGLFHLAIKIPPLSKSTQISQVDILKPKESESFLEIVKERCNMKPSYMAIPEGIITSIKQYNPPKDMTGFAVRLKESVELLAEGSAKLSGNQAITVQDYNRAWRLITLALQSLSKKRKRL